MSHQPSLMRTPRGGMYQGHLLGLLGQEREYIGRTGNLLPQSHVVNSKEYTLVLDLDETLIHYDNTK